MNMHCDRLVDWELPLRLVWFWIWFPITALSIPFAMLGIVRIRRYGRSISAAGAELFLMWAWLGCGFALFLAVLRASQLLFWGSYSELF